MTKDLKLFHWWDVDSLDYALEETFPGHILVLATTIEKAREIAEQAFLEEFKKNPRSFPYNASQLFKEDLKKPPNIYENPHAIFIRGSS